MNTETRAMSAPGKTAPTDGNRSSPDWDTQGLGELYRECTPESSAFAERDAGTREDAEDATMEIS